MNELRPRDWVLLLSATIGFGVLTWLEAYGITELGRGTTNTPRWIMLLIGSMFIAAGLVILFRVRGRLNDLFAFAIIGATMRPVTDAYQRPVTPAVLEIFDQSLPLAARFHPRLR